MGKHFVVFIEGVHNQAEDHLRRVGLGDLVAGASFEAMGTESPSGKPGMLFRWKHEASDGLKIKWVPARPFEGLEANRYWLGYWPDELPGPLDLMKRHGYPLIQAYVRNGVQWPLPQAQDAPADVIWNADGTFGSDIEQGFRDFWQVSETWRLEWVGAGEPPLAVWFKTKPEAERFAMICRCFREVYRIVPELLTELRLLGRADWHVPVDIAIGTLLTEQVTAALAAAVEKKAEPSITPSGADTSPGVAASPSDAPVTPITTC